MTDISSISLQILSVETLKVVKKELELYVRDISKDISFQDTRTVISGLLNELEELDKAIQEKSCG